MPASATNLMVYGGGNSVEIRYPLRGKDVFAHATWRPVPAVAADYQCQFAVLSFARERRATRKSVVSPGHQLVIRDAKQWQQLLLGVFAGLTPRQSGHGALLLDQQMELVLYRDAAGSLKAVPLQEKPPELAVDRTYSDRDFSREAIKLLANGADAVDRSQSRFLFMTGEDPAFVLVDSGERLVVFLAFPKDPEAEPFKVPGGIALRALNTLLIKSFVVTAVKNPVSLVTRGIWHLGSSGMTVVDALPADSGNPSQPLYEGPGMDLRDWEKELDGQLWAPRYQGRLQFFIDGNHFFPALIQSVEGATRSVDVMVYTFDTDIYAVQVANVLKQVSKSVRVRVLMDDLGSLFPAGAPATAVPPAFEPPGDIKSYLEDHSRVRVRVTSDPWLTTDHRKCMIIDRREAYLGGMNIGWVYRYQWHDLMVGLTGPVVGRLEKEYRKAWAFSGPFGDFAYAWAALFDRQHLRRNAEPGDIEIRVLRTATAKLQIYRAQLAAIRRAKRYIYIENAYFNDDKILRALITARQRGVDVRVILPTETDVDIMQTGNLVMANEMIREGIRVYLYPGMTHVKAAIYDGWACVGSANLDKMSLRISQEMDVAFSDPTAVDRLNEELFTVDFSRARELKSPMVLDWLDPLVKALADQL
ncbi:MAG TPA: phosphatidylserine/phosphatidylglycerophosphate/cardiolipin synthase family protein [Candidatus Acidoferrales bacterium]|nr:phosphatidylserine/phosphatidylglycerophosphate/cardiolipin synthase family protein [Candidatus Acidoferrales bacterium]